VVGPESVKLVCADIIVQRISVWICKTEGEGSTTESKQADGSCEKVYIIAHVRFLCEDFWGLVHFSTDVAVKETGTCLTLELLTEAKVGDL